MVILMKQNCTKENVQEVVETLKKCGLGADVSEGTQATIIGILGDKSKLGGLDITLLDGVENWVPIMHSYKLASRDMCPDGRLVHVGDQVIGGKKLVMMGGPCAVENEECIMKAAIGVKAAGATFLRGGAYKPRTSPYSFQGLEEEGLKLLRKAADATGLKVVSEVMASEQIDTAIKYCDMFQIGARNMQNFDLLKKVGAGTKKPILLKRGLSATFEEWIMSAEYIMANGNPNVILCERGVRTFETYTRNTLDLQAIPVVKKLTHLPIIIDPSHAGGKWWLVEPMAKAAVAAGADGLMIEVHNNPEKALCDGPQSLRPEKYEELLKQINKIADVVGKKV
mgnify:CR=1 FL=1